METIEDYVRRLYKLAAPSFDDLRVERDKQGAHVTVLRVHTKSKVPHILIGKNGGTVVAVKHLAHCWNQKHGDKTAISAVAIELPDSDLQASQIPKESPLNAIDMENMMKGVLEPIFGEDIDIKVCSHEGIIRITLSSKENGLLLDFIWDSLKRIIRCGQVARGQIYDLERG